MLLFALGFSAFLFSLVLTPLCRNWFIRFGLVDRPDGRRKLHGQPIPHLGGVPILLSCVLAAVVLSFPKVPLSAGTPLILKLIPAAALVFATGLGDDLFKLRPWQKLLGQLGAAILAYLGGVQITGVAGYTTQS